MDGYRITWTTRHDHWTTQNIHGFEWGIKQTWHQVIAVSDLAVFNKSQKTTTASRSLCKLVALNTRHIMKSGLHHNKDGMIVLLKHIGM